MTSLTVDTPVGPVTIHGDRAVQRVSWTATPPSPDAGACLVQAAAELSAYFEGHLTRFSVPLDPRGSAFQRRVLHALCDIPFGETVTYGDLARRLGVSAQAIGQACGANPLPIFIPCHRVLSATGLGGYSGAGGSETKVALLRHEGAGGLLI